MRESFEFRQEGSAGMDGPASDSHDEFAGRALVPRSVHERRFLFRLRIVLPDDNQEGGGERREVMTCVNDVSTYSMNTVISIIQELFHLCFNELKKYSVDELSVCGLVGIIGRKELRICYIKIKHNGTLILVACWWLRDLRLLKRTSGTEP